MQIFRKIIVSELLLLYVFAYVCNAVTPLPRIKARVGSPYAEFYNSETGKVFTPIGSSYVQLWGGYFHCNFVPGLYDPNAAENALTIMQQSECTLVRIWCYYGNPTLRGQSPPLYSIEGPYLTNGPELYRPYLNNLLDFLTRANRHGIYVQLVIDRTPDNTYYNNLVNTGYWDYVTGQANREYMVASAITAKQIYIGQLMQAIIDCNPNLLSTIFGYELRNEIVSRADKKPFNQLSGWVFTGNGIEYDMNSPASRQACQNENIKNWANKCIDAIKEYDTEAMVCCSLFTFNCTGKDGLAGKGLLPATKPGSWPALPSLLLETNLDYVDIHSYIPNDLAHSLESSLWYPLDKTLKPFTCGEFGAFRDAYPDVSTAASALYDYRETILDVGFCGALIFTWDAYTHTRWTAMEDGTIINERLKPQQWSDWQFNQNDFTQFWYSGHSVSGFNTSGGKLVFNISGNDAFLYSPLTRLDSSEYRYLKIKLKNQTAGTEAQLFWITKTNGTWNEAKSVKFNIVPNSSDFKMYLVDLCSNTNWSGLVEQLRFDPADNSVSYGHYEIDFMKVIKDNVIIYSDINEDDIVDYRDFSTIAQSWQENLKDWSQGDLNNDLSINNEDIEKFMSEWLQEIN